MPKYYWIPTLIIMALFMAYFGMQAWHQLTLPLVLDYVLIEGKLTPVTMTQLPDIWYALMVLPMMASIWWNSPLYIFIPFNLFMVWCAYLIMAYRPCISIR